MRPRCRRSDLSFPTSVSLAVLVVARMDAAERYKGHDQLLEAWPTVRAQVPGAKLVFAGTGDDVPRYAKAKAQAIGIESDVLFTGFVSAAVAA